MQAEKIVRKMKAKLQSLECGGCGYNDRLLLHSVRHRGSYRRLCTNCVLKSQQGHFCPICLHVFDTTSPSPSPPPPHARLTCVQCPSICHLSCASSSSSSSSSSSFLCPPCSNPNLAFFQVNGDNKVMDMGSAKALVAAAKIAAFSMSKAAAVARVEAERRVKEAALAKKRARDALERLLYLAADEKDKGLKKMKSNKPHVGGAGGSNHGGVAT